MLKPTLKTVQPVYYSPVQAGVDYEFNSAQWQDLENACKSIVTYHSKVYPNESFRFEIYQDTIIIKSQLTRGPEIHIPLKLSTKKITRPKSDKRSDLDLIAAIVLVLHEASGGKLTPSSIENDIFFSRGTRLLTAADPYFYDRHMQADRRKLNFGFNLSRLEVQALQVLLTEQKLNTAKATLGKFKFKPKLLLRLLGEQEYNWEKLTDDPRIERISIDRVAEHCGNLVENMQVMYPEEYQLPSYRCGATKSLSFYTLSPEDQARCLYLYVAASATTNVIAISLDNKVDYSKTVDIFKQEGHKVYTTIKEHCNFPTYINLATKFPEAERQGIFENR
jgi:hypothetical protein